MASPSSQCHAIERMGCSTVTALEPVWKRKDLPRGLAVEPFIDRVDPVLSPLTS